MQYLSLILGAFLSLSVGGIEPPVGTPYTILLSIDDSHTYCSYEKPLDKNGLAKHTQEGTEFVFFPSQVLTNKPNDKYGKVLNLLVTGTNNKDTALEILANYTQDRLKAAYKNRSLS